MACVGEHAESAAYSPAPVSKAGLFDVWEVTSVVTQKHVKTVRNEEGKKESK